MRDVLLISRREFRERVASRAFIVGTLLFPLVVAGLVLLPRLVGSGQAQWNLTVVNEGQTDLAGSFARALTEASGSDSENTYRVRPVTGQFNQLRESLNARVETKEIDGYVVLPADVAAGGTILFRARNVGSLALMRDLRNAGTTAVQTERLRMAGIAASALAGLIAPVAIEQARLTSRGDEVGGGMGAFLAAYVLSFLIYFMTTVYGVAVMHSVLEEKTNRTAEVLMSTVRASHVIAGKIIGVGSAAVAQVLIWIIMGGIAVTQLSRLSSQLRVSDAAVRALSVEPLTGVLLFLYFVLGFFLYASTFAIVGASVTSQQESQSVQFVALVPLMVPLLFLRTILNAPLGVTTTALSIVPFTAPIAMPIRMTSTTVPGIEIVASLASLICCIAVVAWVAGKVYRVGMLSTGKRPSLTELARWVCSA